MGQKHGCSSRKKNTAASSPTTKVSGVNTSVDNNEEHQQHNAAEEVVEEEEVEEEEAYPSVSNEPGSAMQGSKAATERLMKELKSVSTEASKTEGINVEPVSDNIYRWHVKLTKFEGCQLAEDLKALESATGKDHVLLEVAFPSTFPKDPPFFRVVYPRFHQYTGHITIGGSICIKELCRSGWSQNFELLSFLVMIRNLLVEGGALVDLSRPEAEYSEEEARAAFTRVAKQHGWKP